MTLGFSLHRKIPCGKVETGGDCEAADAVMVSAINEGGSQPAPPLGSRLKNPLKVAMAAMIRGRPGWTYTVSEMLCNNRFWPYGRALRWKVFRTGYVSF